MTSITGGTTTHFSATPFATQKAHAGNASSTVAGHTRATNPDGSVTTKTTYGDGSASTTTSAPDHSKANTSYTQQWNVTNATEGASQASVQPHGIAQDAGTLYDAAEALINLVV